MDRLVDHLLVFEGDGVVRDYPGNYTQYRIEQAREEKVKETAASTPAPQPDKKEEADKQKKRKLSYKEQRELEQLDKELPILETEKQNLTEKMSSEGNYEALQKMADRINEIENLLAEKEMRWLELSELAGE
ncbi:MAG: hypothetical protein MUF62_08065 [Chitinophagaceae bacterium]|nr:hypothetical protein [Chitinophagaceae bacterium]